MSLKECNRKFSRTNKFMHSNMTRMKLAELNTLTNFGLDEDVIATSIRSVEKNMEEKEQEKEKQRVNRKA
jgi:gluconate kinase